MSDTASTLDLRTMLPFSRSQRIFHAWMLLSPGESLCLVDDHDPRPLRDRFEAECKDQFRWTYERKGPEEWIVNVVKKK
jgi:uncharacterized protein (DUF2249 family)